MNINQNMDEIAANQKNNFLSVNGKNIAKNIALFLQKMRKYNKLDPKFQ